MNTRRPSEPARHIGMKLRIERIASKMRAVDLAKKSGISVSTISRIERGTADMRLIDFVSICQVIGVSPHKLLCGSEVWNPTEVTL